MVLRKLFPVLFLFVAVNETAQPIKTQTTAQLLKTASTLLQAQQLEAAEEYYNTALTNPKPQTPKLKFKQNLQPTKLCLNKMNE